ncbi:MAG: VCBS repeat-containing protein [Acidobacteria bacterium]|nr:VCBS repeat-containing protein [Acidobacteriota bacterium]
MPINAGQTINGTLATSDCVNAGRYYDQYTFSGTSGQRISIAQNSTNFDTYLYLINSSGQIITEDDDGGGGTNSRIPATSGFFTLPATGTYSIWASSFFANQTGTYTVSLIAGTVPPTTRRVFDFDGDGKSDVSVFRPSNGTWHILQSQNGLTGGPFGQNGDRIAPADYDGDGKTDVAVFRGTVPGAGNYAYFYITNSSDNSFRPVQFGATGDVPVSGDWDGDGKADVAVYRDGSLTGGQSYFYYRPSSAPGVNFRTIAWGTNGDKPLVGDFDGDRRLDAAVFRPSNGTWYILRSSNNQSIQEQFGVATDVPTPVDLDGDGITNIAVFRPSTGTWYTSLNPAINYGPIQFGAAGDLPIPADYDGDGKTDIAVYRPSNGWWYLRRSTAGDKSELFGNIGDKPIPNAYIR